MYDPRSSETRVELRILLDGGSQRSYVTEGAVKALKLEPIGEQQLSIAAFGSARGGPQLGMSHSQCGSCVEGVSEHHYPPLCGSHDM